MGIRALQHKLIRCVYNDCDVPFYKENFVSSTAQMKATEFKKPLYNNTRKFEKSQEKFSVISCQPSTIR